MNIQGFASKPHNKRPSGLTHLIKNTLLQSQQKYQQKQIIENLIAKFNSSPSRNKINNSPSTHARKPNQNQKQPTLLAQRHRYQTNGLLSVKKQVDGQLPNRRELLKVSSADKVSFYHNNSRLKRKGKRPDGQCTPKCLESTQHSANSQSEALKQQNERIRALCSSEEQRLKQLQEQITEQKKLQLLKRFLYQQRIQKLKRIADIQIFPQKQICCNEQHEWDSLSIESLT